MENLFRYQLDKNQRGVLVERKALVASDDLELYFYETIVESLAVGLEFNTPAIGIMIRGEKIVEMEDLGRFTYLPGESLIIPAGQKLCIDFPTASLENPTQCLAFQPKAELIEEAVFDYHNRTNALELEQEAEIDFSEDLLMRDEAILYTVEHLMRLFQENNEHRDLFISMTTKELIIRILQSKARRAFLNNFYKRENRMTHVASYIRENIFKPISIQDLSHEANMSRSNFFNLFKDTFGITPNEYIIREKIEKAKAILCSPKDTSITQIAYQLGYSDSSYFSKQFKRVTGFTPRQYESMRMKK
ncbi:MAG: AraC family transcriptional regulator [Bacteroidota bacterium]